MTNKELQNRLSCFPPDAPVCNDSNSPEDSRLILCYTHAGFKGERELDVGILLCKSSHRLVLRWEQNHLFAQNVINKKNYTGRVAS